MAYSTIDMGGAAIARGLNGYGNGNTILYLRNPANASGVLTSFELWLGTADATGTVVGTMYGSSTTYSARDHEDLGTVFYGSMGSKQTFTGKNCEVSSGDYGGIYHTGSATVDCNQDGGGNGYYYKEGYYLESVNVTGYTTEGYDLIHSHYATGVTVPDAPTSVSATDNLTDKVTITWTAGTGETDGHKVYRDGSVLNSDTAISHGTNTFDDTTGTVGTTYAYTVKAINAAGLSAASTADNGTRIASNNSNFFQLF